MKLPLLGEIVRISEKELCMQNERILAPIEENESKSLNLISIQLVDRAYYLKADTREDANAWVSALQALQQEGKRVLELQAHPPGLGHMKVGTFLKHEKL